MSMPSKIHSCGSICGCITYVLWLHKYCISIIRKSNHKNVFYWASTFPCNTYLKSYWQRRLYLLCRGADFRSRYAILVQSKHIGNMCMRLRNAGKGESSPTLFPCFAPNTTNLCKWTTTLLGRLRNFGRIYLPKSTPNNCAIYNTTNKPKTRTPMLGCYYVKWGFSQ
jgi:hypothetical protein